MSVLMSRFDFRYDSVDINGGGEDAKGTQSRNLWAFAPGAGFNYPFKEKFSVRFDYQYRFYSEFNLRNTNDLGTPAGLLGPAGLGGKVKIHDQIFMLGISRKF